jgi:hypothetical protein
MGVPASRDKRPIIASTTLIITTVVIYYFRLDPVNDKATIDNKSPLKTLFIVFGF